MFETFRKDLDIIISIMLTLLCIAFVFVPPLKEIPVRIFIGIPLMLFLPGYSLMITLFPRKEDLDGVERMALSFLLSLAVVPLLGMILNFTPFGILLEPVLIILSTFTISISLIAWVRRLKLPAEERFRVPFESLFKSKEFFIVTGWDKVLSLILVTSIIASIAMVVYVVMIPKTGERFTEFYLLGPSGIASDYPTDLNFGEEGKVIINIVNHEHENINYYLEINFNGYLIHKEKILLIENEKWESPFTFKTTKKGENQKLEFILYQDQKRESYRTLHLWVNVT